MRTTGGIIILFGILVGLGGLMGYIKSGSLSSLIMGGGFGVVLIFSGWIIALGKKFGQYLALALTLTLAGFFGLRFLSSHKMMPAGAVLILSLIATMALLVSMQHRK